ncbi:MAG: mechanosensitive ion channel domain-containing protein [Patescibacteria group bacterium]
MDLSFEKIIASFLTPALRVVIVVLIAFLANRLAKTFINKMTGSMVRHRDALSGRLSGSEDVARIKTLKKAFASIFSVAIWLIAVLTLLPQFGIDIAPILAAVGVGGLALGLATQSIIKDYLAGIFILLEDQFRVGEEVEIASQAGKVEDFTLRRTVLRNKENELCYIPNNQISSVANLTRGTKTKLRAKSTKKG